MTVVDFLYQNVRVTMAVIPGEKWKIQMIEFPDSFSRRMVEDYHCKTERGFPIHVNIFFYRGSHVMYPIQRMARRTIDIHELATVFASFYMWKPHMKDMWRKLRGYL